MILSSDNDASFNNDVIEGMSNCLRISKRNTSPYYPRSNGIAERNVGLAKNVLMKLLKDVTVFIDDENGHVPSAEWDELLPLVELSLNCRVSRAIKTSPFELFFCRPFAGFSDFRNSIIEPIGLDQLKSGWRTIYRSILSAVDAVRRHKREIDKRAFANRHKIVEFDEGLVPGTIVMYLSDGQDYNSMLAQSEWVYSGPCSIVR